MTRPDDPLRRFAGYGMKRAFNAIRADVNQVLRPFGLRMVTFSALVVIARNPGLNQGQLAEALDIERSNISAILTELTLLRLITRVRSDADRRSYVLRLTDKGATTHAQAERAVAAHDARMLAGLSVAEADALRRALRKIEANGEEAHAHAD